MNIKPAEGIEEQISSFLALIGQPVRVQILTIIGAREACVCHLEAVLGCRQASISQHLMVLRRAGLVTAQRDGRNMFYRLSDPAVSALIHQAALLSGANPAALQRLAVHPVDGCTCPHCNPDQDQELTCQEKKLCRTEKERTK